MAPIKEKATDNISSILDDGFANGQCPMRHGNVRCRCKSRCNNSLVKDGSTPEEAAARRNQIVQDVTSFPRGITFDAPVWSTVQGQVDTLVSFVLCQKHLSQHDEAVRTTMSFLRRKCGIFVDTPAVEAPPSQAFVHPPSLPEMVSTIPGSLYASAATHQATPLGSFAPPVFYQTHQHHPVFETTHQPTPSMSPAPSVFHQAHQHHPVLETTHQPTHSMPPAPSVFHQTHQHHPVFETTHQPTASVSPAPSVLHQTHQHPTNSQASHGIERTNVSGPASNEQELPYFTNYHLNTPVKAEPIFHVHATQPQHLIHDTSALNKGNDQGPSHTKPSEPQQLPTGHSGHPPTSVRHAVSTPVIKQNGAETIEQQPQAASTILPPREEGATDSKSATLHVPYGFRNYSRTEEQAPTQQSAQPVASSKSSTRSSKRSSKCSVASQDKSKDEPPRSQVDETVDSFKALELRNKKLAKKNEKLKAENQRLEEEIAILKGSNQKLNDKVEELQKGNASLQSEVSNHLDRIGDLEDEEDDLQYEVRSLKAKLEKAEMRLRLRE